MNYQEVNEAIKTLNVCCPRFVDWMGERSPEERLDMIRLWAGRWERYELSDLMEAIEERSRKGWGPFGHQTALEDLWSVLRVKQAAKERQRQNREIVREGSRPGVMDAARTTFQAIDAGDRSAKEQCQMLEKIYHAVYEELGIEVTKNGPSGMHAAKLAGKAEEVKAEVRRRWLEYLEAEHNITAGV